MSKYQAIFGVICLALAAFFGSSYDEMYIWVPKYNTTLNGFGIVLGVTFILLYFIITFSGDGTREIY